jgi:hypothetical protein
MPSPVLAPRAAVPRMMMAAPRALRALAIGLVPLSLWACSDYDLSRPDKEEPAGEDTGTEAEPTPDPDIAVWPLTVDFGGHPKDCPAEPLEVTITNEGQGALEVTEITLDGSGLSAFATDWDGAPFTLAFEETRTVTVAFTPLAWVTYDVDVDVISNDPDEGTVSVDALGFGAEDTFYEQTFVQEYHTEVDVLWVIDNSCSMDEEMQQVALNFSSFVAEFVDLGLDYHLAVVTTDMDEPTDSGRFQGPVLTSDTPDIVAEFIAQVDQGSAGSGSERGFDAVQAALTEPLLSAENADFLREDAALAVVVLSDEDDDSAMGASTFSSWFLSLKADPGQVSFSAICGDRTWGCQEFDFLGNTLSASGGDQYIDATLSTGGFFASICTADYTEVLQQISLTAAGMTVQFFLDFPPSSQASLQVHVDGTPITNDAANGWTYDSATVSLIFHGDAIPGPGASVIVAYPVAAECE